jgi:hypothetical protein
VVFHQIFPRRDVGRRHVPWHDKDSALRGVSERKVAIGIKYSGEAVSAAGRNRKVREQPMVVENMASLDAFLGEVLLLVLLTRFS